MENKRQRNKPNNKRPRRRKKNVGFKVAEFIDTETTEKLYMLKKGREQLEKR